MIEESSLPVVSLLKRDGDCVIGQLLSGRVRRLSECALQKAWKAADKRCTDG